MLALALAPGLSACAASPGEWQKPGESESSIARDSADCRSAAQEEAMRIYPYTVSSSYSGAPTVVMATQQRDSYRAAAEKRYFDECMQSRGYARPAAPAVK